MKLNLRTLYWPKSPVVSDSSRRNCPCCEDSWNLAELDTPTPKKQEKTASVPMIDKDNPGFALFYRYYTSGSLHKVVRRKPFSPHKKEEDHQNQTYTRSFFNKSIKKLTIHPKKGINKKNQNPVFKEKEIVVKNEERLLFKREEVERLWSVQEKISRKTGGLNKLQKVLKRSNLPPLATSVKNLRIRRQSSFSMQDLY